MKIYFKNITIDENTLNKIDIYKKHIYTNNFIYSQEGVFQIKNNKIMKVKSNDKTLIYDNFEEHEIIVDNSYFQNHHEVYQLPYEHLNLIQTKYIYKLRDKAPISLEVIKNSNNDIEYFYFNIHNEECISILENYSYKEDIISFLSYLI